MQGMRIIACACILACANAAAQDAANTTSTARLQPGSGSAQEATAPASPFLPAGQPIPLAPDKEWSSATLKQGETVAMHVSDDVLLDGKTVIPSGTPASGEVIDSQSGGVGGAPGKLSISAREIRLGDRTIALRSRLLAGNGVGKDRTNVSFAVGIAVGVFGLFVHGGDITIPAGTPMLAKLAQDTFFATADSPVTSQP